MTDRVQGFTVTLEKDIRDDDFEYIQKAVMMIKGVAHVEPSIVTHEDYQARAAVKQELHRELKNVISAFFIRH